jgi:hypothetical protein
MVNFVAGAADEFPVGPGFPAFLEEQFRDDGPARLNRYGMSAEAGGGRSQRVLVPVAVQTEGLTAHYETGGPFDGAVGAVAGEALNHLFRAEQPTVTRELGQLGLHGVGDGFAEGMVPFTSSRRLPGMTPPTDAVQFLNPRRQQPPLLPP